MSDAMNEQAQQYQQLVAKCWGDDAFKQKLLEEPVATLRQEGWEFPEGLNVKVVVNTKHKLHIVIPARRIDLSDEELNGVAGGLDIKDFGDRVVKPTMNKMVHVGLTTFATLTAAYAIDKFTKNE